MYKENSFKLLDLDSEVGDKSHNMSQPYRGPEIFLSQLEKHLSNNNYMG